MRIKDFKKELAFFEHQNEQTGLIYKYDCSLHYKPHVLMDKDRRPIGYFGSQEELANELKKYDIEELSFSSPVKE